MKHRKGEEDGLFRVWFFLEVFRDAQRGAGESRGLARRIGGRRDKLLETGV